MGVIDKVNEVILGLAQKLLRAIQILENDIFSEELDSILSEIDVILRELTPAVSEFIEASNSKKISPSDFSAIISKFYDVEELFSKLVSGLRKISDSDSKRIEQIFNIQNQVKSAYQLSLRGTQVKKKT